MGIGHVFQDVRVSSLDVDLLRNRGNRQRYLHGNRNGGAYIDVLSRRGESVAQYLNVIVVEWDVREPEHSGRVCGRHLLESRYGVVELNHGVDQDRSSRIGD